MFVSMLTPEMHQTFCDTIAFELPGDKSFEELSTIMQNYLEPSPTVLAKPQKFVSKLQESGEEIAVDARELKRFAMDWIFNIYN